ncbi:glutamate--tRNA ligase [archaeon]|nr:glutamate--tRNA ligase [archaeon]
MLKDAEKVILKHALANALKYNGKANLGAVIGRVLAEKPGLKEDIKLLQSACRSILDEVNAIGLEGQKKRLLELFGDIKEKEKPKQKLEMPNAIAGKVVLRIAPFPSGPLHIGNLKTCIINDQVARNYKGKLLLVIDDTIGSEEKQIIPEAYKLIPAGLNLIGIKAARVIFKSDRLGIYYKHAEELIKKDAAYICVCAKEKLHEYREKGLVCDCRANTAGKNLSEWKKMFSEYNDGEACLRLKTSIEHPNPAFRDRVLFRICSRQHPRTKKKYRVWPLLEFSWAIDDYLLGITHIIRGKELMMESEMERFIWDVFGWKHAEIIHIGLLQIEGIKLSKSKSAKEVLAGKYFGWDDPRTWSVQSLIRRGFLPEALREFCLGFGLNQNEACVSVENLYAINRKMLDKKARRYFFIYEGKKIGIAGFKLKKAYAPLHPDFPKYGKRAFNLKSNKFLVQDKIEKGKIYRLMHLFNFKNRKFISYEHEPRLKAKLIHWLPAEGNMHAEILMPDGSVKRGFVEKDAKKIKIGDVVQFERFGFARLDSKTKDCLHFWFAHG